MPIPKLSESIIRAHAAPESFSRGKSYYDRGAIYSRDTFLSSLTDRTRLGGDNYLLDVDFPGRISQGA